MASAPPIIFEVNFVVPGEMRWCMRAKGTFDDWIHSDAASDRPIDQLPAADLALQTDACEVKLTWIELQATNAWAAIQRASGIVEEVLPELLRTRALRVDATLQNPDTELRRPVGS
ncbi:MAG TPA: hypothetical protein VGC59_09525 [Solirubrobacteraceae bacterium]|jgi:hypothetical protein